MHQQGFLAQKGRRVGEQRNETAMIEMRVGQEDMIDPGHLLQAQVTDTRAGIDQDIVVQQQRGGAPRTADSAITAEYGKFHFPSELTSCTGVLSWQPVPAA